MNSSNGWVKIHRQILEWEWYDDHNVKIVFFHLLLRANHKQKKYRGLDLKPGSVLVGREKLSIEVGLSVQKVRTALSKLESTNELTIETTKKGTIIQVVNYEKYQVSTNDLTDNQPTSNQQVTTNKNVKKERSIFKPPTKEEVLQYCNESEKHIDVERFVDFYSSKGWMVGKNKMKDWKAAVRNWYKQNPKQPKETPKQGFPDMDKVNKELERYGIRKG